MNYLINILFNKEVKDHPFTYRNAQLDSLRAKASEEERLEEINKQIYNLQNLKYVSLTKNIVVQLAIKYFINLI